MWCGPMTPEYGCLVADSRDRDYGGTNGRYCSGTISVDDPAAVQAWIQHFCLTCLAVAMEMTERFQKAKSPTNGQAWSGTAAGNGTNAHTEGQLRATEILD